MTGFVVTAETAAAILAGIEQAQRSRGLPHYWTTGAYPIHSGPHKGKTFIPADDAMLSTPIRRGMAPRDFPEFASMVEALGGLAAREDIDPTDLIDPTPTPP